MYVRANIESNLHHYEQAEHAYREVIALRERADSGTHTESLFPINGLAVVLCETGRADEALALLDEALPRADGHSDNNIVYGRMLGTYGYAQMKKGQWQNARATLELDGGLTDLLWSFAPAVRAAPSTIADVPATSPESVAMAKALKRRGFRFVGPTTAYALMQATGIVNDHTADCWVRTEL